MKAESTFFQRHWGDAGMIFLSLRFTSGFTLQKLILLFSQRLQVLRRQMDDIRKYAVEHSVR